MLNKAGQFPTTLAILSSISFGAATQSFAADEPKKTDDTPAVVDEKPATPISATQNAAKSGLSGSVELYYDSGLHGQQASVTSVTAPSANAILDLTEATESFGDFSLHLANSIPFRDRQSWEVDAHVSWSKEIAPQIKIGAGFNNYFYPISNAAPHSYHELEVTAGYEFKANDTSIATLAVTCDQEIAGADYTYLSTSLSRDWTLNEQFPQFTLTTKMQADFVLAPGSAYPRAGVNDVDVGAILYYQPKENAPFIFVGLDSYTGLLGDRAKESLELAAGVRFEF